MAGDRAAGNKRDCYISVDRMEGQRKAVVGREKGGERRGTRGALGRREGGRTVA